MAWLVLTLLTAYAAHAALGVSLRARPAGRAETALAFLVLFAASIVAPVFLLGYTNLLRPRLLAVTSVLTSTIAFVASARGRSLSAHAREIRGTALRLARMPWDALRSAWRARSLVVVGLAAATFAIVGSAWIAYLAPSECWDGFFYHEPIVAFALQNHGFRMVNLPPAMVVQGVNGYPKFCEALSLWFVIFTDKTLIEIGNTLLAPGLGLAVYVMGRRYCQDRVLAMGWGTSIILLPAMLTELRSSMIDPQVMFFLLASTHYATRPALRVRDAVMGSLCMAIVMATKSSGLVWVPPIALVTYGRLLMGHARRRRWASVGVTLGGGLAIAGVGALTFVRNWLAFKNPIWPVTYSNAKLHIDWPGLVSLADLSPEPPARDMLKSLYHQPLSGVAEVIARAYGYVTPWFLLPLGLVSVVAALLVAVRGLLSRERDSGAENVLLLAALALAFVKGSPSLWIGRYNAQIFGIVLAVICWGASRLRSARFHEGAVTITLFSMLMTWVWFDWFFNPSMKYDDVLRLTLHSEVERRTMHVESFQMPREVAVLRELELGPGDLVVFTQEISFPGVLWNHQMSNRAEYVEVHEVPEFLAELEARRPKWVVVGANNPGRAALDARPAEWEYVGLAVRGDGTAVYRRKA